MRVRDGLSNIITSIGNNNYSIPLGYKVGKVYAVILGPQSVPTKVWEANGEWSGIGTIVYEEYNEDSEITLENLTNEVISNLPTALPLYPNQKYFPLPGEIVLLMDLPSAPSPITDAIQETYYLSVINAWNSTQFNGLFLDEDKNLLYESFNENPDFRGLQTFEGDYILEGRFGSSVRFGSTNKSGFLDLSPWSTNPGELDNNPITILSNQHNNKVANTDLYVEDINKDGSSLYLTSNQVINLSTGNVVFSNITSPLNIRSFKKPQAIINADRTIISSKSDEVFIIGKTGVELYSQGPVYMQSDKVGLVLQDNSIFLGPYSTSQGSLVQPLVLGNDLKAFLSNLIASLSDFSSILMTALSTPEGTPIMEVNIAAEMLQGALETYSTELQKANSLVSNTTFTI
jgi:hypothetical protein